MGSPERLSVAEGGIEIFKFIIDEKEDVQITSTVHSGNIKTAVNSEPSLNNVI